MPFVGFFSRMSLLAGLLLAAVLPLMRLCAVRLRERRSWLVEASGCCVGVCMGVGVGVVVFISEADAAVEVGLVLMGCCVMTSSRGKSNWVGETLAPRLPFWLEVVTDSEDVAVVVWGAPSILTVCNQQRRPSCAGGVDAHPPRQCVSGHLPSGSEMTTEFLPLRLCPRWFEKMEEPIE